MENKELGICNEISPFLEEPTEPDPPNLPRSGDIFDVSFVVQMSTLISGAVLLGIGKLTENRLTMQLGFSLEAACTLKGFYYVLRGEKIREGEEINLQNPTE